MGLLRRRYSRGRAFAYNLLTTLRRTVESRRYAVPASDPATALSGWLLASTRHSSLEFQVEVRFLRKTIFRFLALAASSKLSSTPWGIRLWRRSLAASLARIRFTISERRPSENRIFHVHSKSARLHRKSWPCRSGVRRDENQDRNHKRIPMDRYQLHGLTRLSSAITSSMVAKCVSTAWRTSV